MKQQQLFKVRDKRNKGWFFMDNEYLNGFGKLLGGLSVAVYVSLCRHADGDQKCFPSQKQIAKELDIGERTVREIIKKLEKHQIIEIERHKDRKGKWLHNIYWLRDKSEWKYPEAYIACGEPEANKDKTRGRVQRQVVPTNNTKYTNNTNKKNTNDFLLKKKRYYHGLEVRFAQNKLWCVPKDGGDWLEFAGDKSEIIEK